MKNEIPPSRSWFVLTRPDRGEGVDHEVIWGGIFILMMVAAWVVPREVLSSYRCPFRFLTGIPCPTCGMTRSTYYSSHLRFYDAFLLNPLGTFLLGLGAIYTVYSVIVILGQWPRIRPNLQNTTLRRVLRLGIPVSLLLNWIYLIAHGT